MPGAKFLADLAANPVARLDGSDTLTNRIHLIKDDISSGAVTR